MNDRRLAKVLYRAPGSDRWEERAWDWAVERIARLIKQMRDERLIERDAAGRTINALDAVGMIGGCTNTNAFRAGLRVIPIEQQSRT